MARTQKPRTRKQRRYGNLPGQAIVSVQQDPNSPTFLTNVNTAMKVMANNDPRFGGKRKTRRRFRR
jgi:hypothetical protein